MIAPPSVPTGWAPSALPAGGFAAFDPIGLAELNRVALLDRVEVKYLLPAALLPDLAAALLPNYRVLTIDGRRLNHYRTLYFDTPDLAMYHRHHMGARVRYKVRSRQYVESALTFLEVKHKTGAQHTVKSRLATPTLITGINRCALAFLADKCPYAALELVPALWNTYTRVTLASSTHCERVTLDLDLAFAWGGRKLGLPALVVAEVKRSGPHHASDFIALMRALGVRKSSFSKYCVGVSLLYPGVKHNRFHRARRTLALLQGAPPGALHGRILEGELDAPA
jgi:hypothetical protein